MAGGVYIFGVVIEELFNESVCTGWVKIRSVGPISTKIQKPHLCSEAFWY